ncbi:MAG: DUF2846 domain-containing protein [Pseudomonadota bacterium]
MGACQSNQTPYTPTAVKKPGNGKIYVYWPKQTWGEKSGQRPEIRLDGVPVGLLRYKHYIELELGAGTYDLALTGESEAAKWNGPELSFPAKVKAGENLYVRLLVKYDQESNRLLEGRMKHAINFLPRAPEQALLEMYGLKETEG